MVWDLITGIQFHAYENYSPIALGLISAVPSSA